MQDERFSVKLTAGELEYAAAALDDLHAWNEAPPSPLAGKLRAAAQGPVARDDTAELREAAHEVVEAYWDNTRAAAEPRATGLANRKAIHRLSAALAAYRGRNK